VSRHDTLYTHWLIVCLAKGVDFRSRMVLAEEDACSRSRTFEIIVHLHHHMLGLCVTLGTLVSKEHLTGSTMNGGFFFAKVTFDIIRIDFGSSFLLFRHSQHIRISRQGSHSSSRDLKGSGTLRAAKPIINGCGSHRRRRFGVFLGVIVLLNNGFDAGGAERVQAGKGLGVRQRLLAGGTGRGGIHGGVEKEKRCKKKSRKEKKKKRSFSVFFANKQTACNMCVLSCLSCLLLLLEVLLSLYDISKL